MRDASQPATVVWLGTLAGVLYWGRIWIAKLTAPTAVSTDLLSILSEGPFTIPLYLPALLGLYAINTGVCLRCQMAKCGYAAYTGLILLALTFGGALPDVGLDQDLSYGLAAALSSVITVAIASVIYVERAKRARASAVRESSV